MSTNMVLHKGFCKINNLEVPYPDIGSGEQEIATMVDSARTADGVMRGEKIGRDVGKVNLKWSVLPPEEWSKILTELDKHFIFDFTYLDMVTNKVVTRKYYCGNRKATPYQVDRTTRIPKYYQDCTVNVIDVGL